MPSIALPLSLRGQLINTAFSPSMIAAGSTAFLWYDPSDVANTLWRRNLLTWTEQFDNAAWTKAEATISANAAIAPDGTMTADKLVENTNNAFHQALQNITSAGNSVVVTNSIYAKPDGRGWLRLMYDDGVNNRGAYFNITSGAVGTADAGVSGSIVAAAEGYYRCSITYTQASASTRSRLQVMLATGDGVAGYVGNGTSGIFIWGAQLELGSVATEYQRITDVNTEVIARFPTATLYQDAAGTTPVTAPAQPVGLVLDKSHGLVLGPELVTNGDFSNGTTGWTLQTGWTIAGGAASFNGGGGANLVQNAGLGAGKTYEITLTVVTISSGAFRVLCGFDTASPNITSAGTYTFRLLRGTNDFIYVQSQGTTVGTIDNISVRELPGFHATQSTAASRPTYGVVPSRGRVNLLTYTEQFDNAAWFKTGITVTANAGISPDGSSTADLISEASTTSEHYVNQTVAAVSGTFTYSVWLKPSGVQFVILGERSTTGAQASFDLSSGSVKYSVSCSATIVEGANGWFLCSMTPTGSFSAQNFGCRVQLDNNGINDSNNYLGNTLIGVYVWGAQLETGSTATPYQRVVSQFDVTDPVGFPSYPCHYLSFDGIDDFMQTATITPNADKVQVFAGVRKLSDAAIGVVLETSANSNSNNGAIWLLAPVTPDSNRYGFRSKGTAPSDVNVTGYTAPITNVVTGIGGIADDASILRVNGAQVGSSSADQGTGNYLAYPLFIGRRGGISLPFNGQLYGLITRFSGANLDASLISNTERWMGGKTGVTIA